MRHVIFWFCFLSLEIGLVNAQTNFSKKTKATTPYPKYRVWTSPSSGEEPRWNSPSFEWPAKKKSTYSIRISSSRSFQVNLIERTDLPYAIFNPHQVLQAGVWYWQHKINADAWSPLDSFTIKSTTPTFDAPAINTVLANIPVVHPRVLIQKKDIAALRNASKNFKESNLIIEKANLDLTQLLPDESLALPTFSGKDDFENEKIAQNASKVLGWRVHQAVLGFSQAYLLTGDEKYFIAAKKWMLQVAKWDPNGATHTNNFGDAGIMSGLAVGVDSFWDLLSPDERSLIMSHVAVRADQFYKLWIGQVESRSSSMHVWQHIMHHLLQTSLALKGELPAASKWMEYIYELWIAQSPKMAEEDGAWFNGTSYFGMNMLTLVDVSTIFKDLTGVDFMVSPWFKNNPRWLMYAFPPGSIADGFSNDGDKHPRPPLNYAGYTDVLSKIFQDPYAAWYSKAVTNSLTKELSDDQDFSWFRIKTGSKLKTPMPVDESVIPQAAVFPEGGVAYMHTTVQHEANDLMLSLRSSPFGPMGHAHADQNTFNIAYGGKRLFNNTGYRPAMGDPHFLDWYKHTRGHNGILIDGQGQPFNASAYGWIPRFLHGKDISYAVGDASNAYAAFDEGQKIDYGMKTFRRHYIMLRPSIIIIYDELKADHPAEWTWLLHNDNGLAVDEETHCITAESEVARSMVMLYSSAPISYNITDQFTIPVDNWTKKIDEEGDTITFKNQWHFKGTSDQKSTDMRYLAIIQVKPDGSFEKIVPGSHTGLFAVGDWKVDAALDASKPASIKVWNDKTGASLVSNGPLMSRGKAFNGKQSESSKLFEVIDNNEKFQEVVDEVPRVLKNLFQNR